MDDWQTALDTYRQTSRPEDLFGVVKHLEPTINQTVISINGSPDPLLMSKARVLAGKAVQTYDPASGTALPTWVTHQLQPLRRFRRQANQVLKVPEGMQLDAYRLHTATTLFRDQHERDPTMEELADAAGMPVKRIRNVQKSQLSTPSLAGTQAPDDNSLMGANVTDYASEALDALYSGSDTLDKMLLEHRFGASGKPPMPTPELLRKTGLSPWQLSRRTTALGIKLDRLTRDIESVYAK